MSGDTIFGYTAEGGINDDGTIFRYVIEKPQITPVEPSKVITLSISKPEEIILETQMDLIIENGNYIDLDTTSLKEIFLIPTRGMLKTTIIFRKLIIR